MGKLIRCLKKKAMLLEKPVETKRTIRSSVIKYKLKDVSNKSKGNKDTAVLRGIVNKSLKIFSTSREKNSIWDKRLDFQRELLDREEKVYGDEWRQQKQLIENIYDTINQITHKDDMIRAKIIKNNDGKLVFRPSERMSGNKPMLTKRELKINNLFATDENKNAGNDCIFLATDACKLFPCSSLTTYTSILGSKNDYRIKTAPSQFLDSKNPHMPSLEDQLNYTKERGKISESELDIFHNKISFKRPIRQAHSVNDLNSRIASVESRVRYCKEKTYLQMAPSDRTIRYGAPLPRNSIYFFFIFNLTFLKNNQFFFSIGKAIYRELRVLN